MTAGTLPSRRTARAIPLPARSRTSAVILITSPIFSTPKVHQQIIMAYRGAKHTTYCMGRAGV